jgi:hypothetical protein
MVAGGQTTDRSKVRFVDLFNKDGRADYVYFDDDGRVFAYANKGGVNNWDYRGRVATGLTSDRTKVRFADFNGDGLVDYLYFDDDGRVYGFFNNGTDAGGGWIGKGVLASGVIPDRSKIRFADFTGDRHADYMRTDGQGTVDAWINHGGNETQNGWEFVRGVVTSLPTGDSAVARRTAAGHAGPTSTATVTRTTSSSTTTARSGPSRTVTATVPSGQRSAGCSVAKRPTGPRCGSPTGTATAGTTISGSTTPALSRSG